MRVVPIAAVAAASIWAAAPAAAQKIDPNALLGLGIEILRQMPAQPQQQPQQQPRQQPASQPQRQVRETAPARPAAPRYARGEVAEAQRLLAALGYDPGPVDGAMGPKTAAALRAFEAGLGMPASGAPSAAVLAALRGEAGRLGVQTAAPRAGAPSTQSADSPGFDCATAASPSEQAICASPPLAALDAAVAQAFGEQMMRSSAGARATLQSEQVAWIGAREGCGREPSCIEVVTRARLAALGGAAAAVAGGGWTAPAEAAPALVTEADGQLWIDGRLAAQAGIAHWGDAVPEGFDLEGRLAPLVRDYALALDDSWLTSDEAARRAMTLLEPAMTAAILEEATGVPMEQSELRQLQLGFRSDPLANLTPFEAQRAIAGLRARADLIVRRDLPPLPLPLRVYCTLDLGDYDFETSSFPVTRKDECEAQIAGAPARADGSGGRWPTPMPDRLAHPLEGAEEFNRLLRDKHMLLASYDVDLSIEAIRSESTSSFVGDLSERRNFVIYEPGSYTAVLRRFDSSGAAPAPAVGRNWDLQDQDARAELAALAGPSAALPADGRAMLRDAAGDLGVIVDRYPQWTDRESWLRNREERSGARVAMARDPALQALANGLGLPIEHFVRLVHISLEREPISAVYGVLKAPAEAFARDSRDDFYGRRRIGYQTTTRIAEARIFALPGVAPALVLVLEPLEGRYLDGDSGSMSGDDWAVLERFDLTEVAAAPVADHPRIEAVSRLALVAQATAALGADLEEVIGNTIDASGLDPFEKHDAVQRLLQRATGLTEPVESIWLVGTFKMGDYDFETESFPPYALSLGHPDLYDADDLPESAVRGAIGKGDIAIRMPPGEARAFAASYPKYRELPIRARFRIDGAALEPGSVRLDLSLLEYEILAEGATVALRDPDRVLYRYDSVAGDAGPPTEASALPPAEVVAPEPVEPLLLPPRDVLGVTLGMPLDAAAALIDAEVPGAERYATTRELRAANSPMTLWEAYATATLSVAPDRGLAIALHSEPPAAGEVVTSVVRSQLFAPGAAPHPDAVRALLVEKYGPPANRSGAASDALIWSLAADRFAVSPETAVPDLGGCLSKLEVQAQLLRMEAGQLRQRAAAGQGGGAGMPPWFGPDGARWTPTGVVVADPGRALRDLGTCAGLGEIVVAMIDVGDDGLAAGLHVMLADPGMVEGLRAENERAASAASGGAGAPEIKL